MGSTNVDTRWSWSTFHDHACVTYIPWLLLSLFSIVALERKIKKRFFFLFFFWYVFRNRLLLDGFLARVDSIRNVSIHSIDAFWRDRNHGCVRKTCTWASKHEEKLRKRTSFRIGHVESVRSYFRNQSLEKKPVRDHQGFCMDLFLRVVVTDVRRTNSTSVSLRTLIVVVLERIERQGLERWGFMPERNIVQKDACVSRKKNKDG